MTANFIVHDPDYLLLEGTVDAAELGYADTFGLAVRINREQLSRLAEGGLVDGAVVLRLPCPFAPPESCLNRRSRKHRPAMCLLLDNSRVPADDADDFVTAFAKFARKQRHVSLVFTIDFARRMELFVEHYSQIPADVETCPTPWDSLEFVVFVYAENKHEAAKTLAAQTEFIEYSYIIDPDDPDTT